MRIIKRIIRYFSYNAASVFITDSNDCPCFKIYEFSSTSTIVKSLKIENIKGKETSDKIRQIRQFNNLLIFAHGDVKTNQCFYKRYENNFEHNILIDSDWWTNFIKPRRSVYFHVCNGSSILEKNKTLKSVFPNWVSYSGIVYGFYSNNQTIKNINKKFFENISNEVSKKESPRALKEAIKGAYYSIKGELYEAGKEEPENMMVGFTAIVAWVGKNINSLNSSED